MTSTSDTPPLEAFLEQYWEDQRAGRIRELPDYLALFPGDPNAIAREYLALAEPSSGEVDTETIGPYRIEEEIGRGGQGVVFKATDTRVGRTVALKVLHALGPGSEEVMLRFKREAMVASRLDDPGICTVYDTGVQNGVPYIAMRYVEGASVAQVISTRKDRLGGEEHSTCVVLSETEDEDTALAPADSDTTTEAAPGRKDLMEVVTFFEKAARSLHEAHEEGVVHRDIKPGNIMLTADGDPMIMDFGLARSEELDLQTLTRTGEFFGTPAYMSPEQLLAQRVKLDRRTDVWSLGVSLYECLTLQRPFEAPTREALYQAIQTKEPEDPHRLNRDIPRDLATVVTVCLTKDRDRRYQTAQDFADDLAAVRELRPIAARPIGPLGRIIRWTKRRPAVATLLVALIVGVPAVAGLSGYLIANLPEIEAQKRRQLYEETERLLEQGFFELHHGNSARAQTAFEAALAKRPRMVEAVAGLALTHLKLKRPQSALEVLDEVGVVSEQATALLPVRADVLEALGRSAEAETARSRDDPSDSAVALFLAATREIAHGHDRGEEDAAGRQAFDNARQLLQQAIISTSAVRRVYHYQLAHALGHLELGEAPQEIVAGIQALWPDSGVSQFWCGFALQKTDPHGAEAAFRAATTINPRDSSSWGNLGAVLALQGRFDDAITAYREAIRLRPEDAFYYLNLGNALGYAQRMDEAIEAWRASIERDPRQAQAHYNLGVAHQNQEHHEEAIEAYRDAIRVDPKHAQAHQNLGSALHDTGRIAEAIPFYREAVRLDPIDALGWGNLGLALHSEGHFEEAVPAFREAFRLDPSFSWADESLRQTIKLLARKARAAFREDEFEEAVSRQERLIGLMAGEDTSDYKLQDAERDLERYRAALRDS